MTFIVSSVHTGSTHGIPGGAGVRRCVADNGGPHECPPQPFWTGVAMAPCLRPFSRRWTHSPYRFMQVPTNADFRSLSDVGTVLHERTLKKIQKLQRIVILPRFVHLQAPHARRSHGRDQDRSLSFAMSCPRETWLAFSRAETSGNQAVEAPRCRRGGCHHVRLASITEAPEEELVAWRKELRRVFF